MLSSRGSLPPGWCRLEIPRKFSNTTKKYDVYFYSDDGVKLRSFPEIEKYFEERKNLKPIGRSCFNFVPLQTQTVQESLEIKEQVQQSFGCAHEKNKLDRNNYFVMDHKRLHMLFATDNGSLEASQASMDSNECLIDRSDESVSSGREVSQMDTAESIKGISSMQTRKRNCRPEDCQKMEEGSTKRARTEQKVTSESKGGLLKQGKPEEDDQMLIAVEERMLDAGDIVRSEFITDENASMVLKKICKEEEFELVGDEWETGRIPEEGMSEKGLPEGGVSGMPHCSKSKEIEGQGSPELLHDEDNFAVEKGLDCAFVKRNGPSSPPACKIAARTHGEYLKKKTSDTAVDDNIKYNNSWVSSVTDDSKASKECGSFVDEGNHLVGPPFCTSREIMGVATRSRNKLAAIKLEKEDNFEVEHSHRTEQKKGTCHLSEEGKQYDMHHSISNYVNDLFLDGSDSKVKSFKTEKCQVTSSDASSVQNNVANYSLPHRTSLRKRLSGEKLKESFSTMLNPLHKKSLNDKNTKKKEDLSTKKTDQDKKLCSKEADATSRCKGKVLHEPKVRKDLDEPWLQCHRSSDTKKVRFLQRVGKNWSTSYVTKCCGKLKGWTRTTTQRQSGSSIGSWDVIYESPTRKRFRSKPDVQRYLSHEKMKISLDLFCFRTSVLNFNRLNIRSKYFKGRQRNGARGDNPACKVAAAKEGRLDKAQGAKKGNIAKGRDRPAKRSLGSEASSDKATHNRLDETSQKRDKVLQDRKALPMRSEKRGQSMKRKSISKIEKNSNRNNISGLMNNEGLKKRNEIHCKLRGKTTLRDNLMHIGDALETDSGVQSEGSEMQIVPSSFGKDANDRGCSEGGTDSAHDDKVMIKAKINWIDDGNDSLLGHDASLHNNVMQECKKVSENVEINSQISVDENGKKIRDRIGPVEIIDQSEVLVRHSIPEKDHHEELKIRTPYRGDAPCLESLASVDPSFNEKKGNEKVNQSIPKEESVPKEEVRTNILQSIHLILNETSDFHAEQINESCKEKFSILQDTAILTDADCLGPRKLRLQNHVCSEDDEDKHLFTSAVNGGGEEEKGFCSAPLFDESVHEGIHATGQTQLTRAELPVGLFPQDNAIKMDFEAKEGTVASERQFINPIMDSFSDLDKDLCLGGERLSYEFKQKDSSLQTAEVKSDNSVANVIDQDANYPKERSIYGDKMIESSSPELHATQLPLKGDLAGVKFGNDNSLDKTTKRNGGTNSQSKVIMFEPSNRFISNSKSPDTDKRQTKQVMWEPQPETYAIRETFAPEGSKKSGVSQQPRLSRKRGDISLYVGAQVESRIKKEVGKVIESLLNLGHDVKVDASSVCLQDDTRIGNSRTETDAVSCPGQGSRLQDLRSVDAMPSSKNRGGQNVIQQDVGNALENCITVKFNEGERDKERREFFNEFYAADPVVSLEKKKEKEKDGFEERAIAEDDIKAPKDDVKMTVAAFCSQANENCDWKEQDVFECDVLSQMDQQKDSEMSCSYGRLYKGKYNEALGMKSALEKCESTDVANKTKKCIEMRSSEKHRKKAKEEVDEKKKREQVFTKDTKYAEKACEIMPRSMKRQIKINEKYLQFFKERNINRRSKSNWRLTGNLAKRGHSCEPDCVRKSRVTMQHTKQLKDMQFNGSKVIEKHLKKAKQRGDVTDSKHAKEAENEKKFVPKHANKAMDRKEELDETLLDESSSNFSSLRMRLRQKRDGKEANEEKSISSTNVASKMTISKADSCGGQDAVKKIKKEPTRVEKGASHHGIRKRKNGFKSPYFSRRYESKMKSNYQLTRIQKPFNPKRNLDLGSIKESWDHDYSRCNNENICRHPGDLKKDLGTNEFEILLSSNPDLRFDKTDSRIVQDESELFSISKDRELDANPEKNFSDDQNLKVEIGMCDKNNSKDDAAKSNEIKEEGNQGGSVWTNDSRESSSVEIDRNLEVETKRLEVRSKRELLTDPCQKCGFIWYGRRSLKARNKCKTCENRNYPSLVRVLICKKADPSDALSSETHIRNVESKCRCKDDQNQNTEVGDVLLDRKDSFVDYLGLFKPATLDCCLECGKFTSCSKSRISVGVINGAAQHANSADNAHFDDASSHTSRDNALLPTASGQKRGVQYRRLGILRKLSLSGKHFKKKDIVSPYFDMSLRNRRSSRIANSEEIDNKGNMKSVKTKVHKQNSKTMRSNNILQKYIGFKRARKSPTDVFTSEERTIRRMNTRRLRLRDCDKRKDFVNARSGNSKVGPLDDNKQEGDSSSCGSKCNMKRSYVASLQKDSAADGTKLACGRNRQLVYKPPKSPYGLVQEQLYDNPWRLLVATIFLNKTSGTLAIPILWKFFELWPDPESTMHADCQEISGIVIFYYLV